MKRMIIEYIKKKTRNTKKYSIHGFLKVYVLQPLPENVELSYVIDKIQNNIPKNFFYNIDGIYITNIPEFEEREINALHKDGVIYITPEQDDNEDLIDDIVHEVGHAVEKYYEKEIYSERSIEKEFLGKRMRLYDLLKADDQNPDILLFKDIYFSREMDDYFYKNVGYDRLSAHTMGLFTSPYAPTSLSEYFAEGFEEYLPGDRKYKKKISPLLYKKIKMLHDLDSLEDWLYGFWSKSR